MPETSSDFAPRAWLELALVPGVSLEAKLAWLNEFKSPGAVLRQGVGSLKQIHPEARPLADQVPAEKIDAVEQWVAGAGGQCLFFGDDDYPSTLLGKIHDVPLAVFARGDLGLLSGPVVALLGAPQPTKNGLERARTFAFELSQEKITCIAGISPGIAQAAHQGVQAAKGKPIGVIGDPRAWNGLRMAEEVAGTGLLVSEMAPHQDVGKLAYARRHRLVVALADLAVVVEAPRNCDTLKLAATAGDIGCDVAAVPTDPGNTNAQGCNALLHDGAALVETSADIIALLAAND